MSYVSQMSLSVVEWIRVDVVDGGHAEQTRGAGQEQVCGERGSPIFTGVAGWFHHSGKIN